MDELSRRKEAAPFVTEQSGLDNLKAEGVPDSQVFFVGNLMID